MTGYYNANDSLWDVPIRTHPKPKATIQVNYNLPWSHHIYLRRSKTLAVTQSPSIKKKKNTKTLNFLNDLASIAEYIAFEEIIQQQLKQDIKTSKINIIIQKKQPKRILAQYLHAAYSSVPSIFIKAKKMKTS